MSQPNSHPTWVGRTISGRYTIEDILGQGGMSSVYKGTDPNLQRTVAIKLIHPHLSRDPEFVRRFEQEAAAVAQLRHQNIIQVYDFNHDDDIYYMVLEFVPGETLQDKLQTLSNAGKQLGYSETINIMATTCDAVGYAHEKGMIHRDLKPANVMINPKEQPILMDFGVAKMLGTSQHTATGAIIGTAKYMSPEQARGDRPDERTDIYSLGVMLYEMVAGTAPYEGESTIAILMKHVTEPLPDIRQAMPNVPSGLVAVIEKALAKNKDDRFRSATEMADALRAVDLAALAVAPQPEPDETILYMNPDATMIKAASAAAVAATPAPAATQPDSKKGGGVPMWAIAAAVVVVLLMVGAGAIFALSGGSDGDTNVGAETGQEAETPVAVADNPTDTPPPPEPVVEEKPEALPTNTPEPPPPTSTRAPEPTEPPAAPDPGESTSDQLPAAADTPEAQIEEPTATLQPEPTEAPPTAPPVELAQEAQMTLIPAGFFLMGSNSGQGNEQPEHPVLLNGYSIDTFEVTNAQYRACVEDGSCTPANTPGSSTRPGYRDDPAFDNYPVVSVSWDQANSYCRWAGKRLPTEAEWEYAAAGPDNFTWPWGNSFDPALSAASTTDTQAVGNFPGGASVFGVFELAGNANEWVADTFNETFYASSPAANPVNTAGGDGRIYRGGSFDNRDGSFYTASRRYGNVRSFSEVDVGFRCAADASNAAPSPERAAQFCAIYEAFKPGAACP